MTDSTPTPEKPVYVATIDVGRLWTLTIVSLTLNVVTLALITIGAIVHLSGFMRPPPVNGAAGPSRRYSAASCTGSAAASRHAAGSGCQRGWRGRNSRRFKNEQQYHESTHAVS